LPLACGSSKRTPPSYSEGEVKAALLGTWQGSAEFEGEVVPFALSLERGATRAPLPDGVIAVAGTLVSENPALNGAVDGRADASEALSSANLAIRVETGGTLLGSFDGDSLTDGRIQSRDLAGTFSLSRP
jgi:hypothetical protein